MDDPDGITDPPSLQEGQSLNLYGDTQSSKRGRESHSNVMQMPHLTLRVHKRASKQVGFEEAFE